MSFSSDVKTEIQNKNFTSKSIHSKIRSGSGTGEVRTELASAFLRCGTVCDPSRMYLMEFSFPDMASAEELREKLKGLDGCADAVKCKERKGSWVVYIQDADVISDLLNLMGAHRSLLTFENRRIYKEMRGNVQRTVNCETANIRKTVSASVRQISDIEYIEQEIGLDQLPEGLREMAEVRLAKPDATLKELSDSVVPPIGRSGVNHRLRKLSRIAEDCRNSRNKEQIIHEIKGFTGKSSG